MSCHTFFAICLKALSFYMNWKLQPSLCREQRLMSCFSLQIYHQILLNSLLHLTCLSCCPRTVTLSSIVDTSPTNADWGQSVLSSVHAFLTLHKIPVLSWNTSLSHLWVLMFSLVCATFKGTLFPCIAVFNSSNSIAWADNSANVVSNLSSNFTIECLRFSICNFLRFLSLTC